MARASKNTTTPSPATPGPEQLDTSVLEALVGYNARRASIAIGAEFFERMAPYGLKQADFSVLALLAHNPGATSRQLCATLDILPPNFVSLIAALDRRGLIERRPHPRDGRAVGLHLTDAGHALAQETEKIVVEMESELAGRLTERERTTLQRLLQKFYLGKGEKRETR
ncbi:MarR family winged helix-turn-helix transcriptional regulator [Pseudorhodoferax sp. Leaf267]|uniref:MarR family winged helix-turn-helix transcriptional regulator n=1 Tax=Pseudorhodoferax sp. Leaf267 TaxID=1736316 RepID=UPI0006F6D42C|nr:MarR family transcriptional regulator [Pseudorhodoferax sp. Leaf267]KQP17627.1 MarR family transcriptional regulator [Pseudorhodoferax sp. Leaf267]